MSCIRDSLTIFWTPTSFGHPISWPLPFITHTVCLIDSGCLHSRAAALFNGSPIVLVSTVQGSTASPWLSSWILILPQGAKPLPNLHDPFNLGFHHDWCCTFASGLSWCQSQLLSGTHLHLLQLSCSENQYRLGDSHTLPSSAASMRCRFAPLWTTAYVYWPWGNIS